MSSSLGDAFFEQLALRGYEPSLAKVSGKVRIEVTDGGRRRRWLLTIEKGRIDVSRRNEHAGTVVRLDSAALMRAAAGKLNLMAAVLRGEIVIEGDARLLVRLQRVVQAAAPA
jgi:putative sterol carrier protein